jgi:hypothetical protein
VGDSLGGKLDKLIQEGEKLSAKDKKRSAKELNQVQLSATLGAMTIDLTDFTVDETNVLGRGAFGTVFAGTVHHARYTPYSPYTPLIHYTVFAGEYQGEEAAVKVFSLENMSVEEQAKLKKGMVKELQVGRRIHSGHRCHRTQHHALTHTMHYHTPCTDRYTHHLTIRIISPYASSHRS